MASSAKPNWMPFDGQELNELPDAAQAELHDFVAFLNEYPDRARNLAIEKMLAFLLIKHRYTQLLGAMHASNLTALDQWRLRHGQPLSSDRRLPSE